MNDHDRLIALARLHMGDTPTEVSERVEGVSYAQALKLKRNLMDAEESQAVLQLFDLDQAALDILIDSVKKGLEPAIEAFGVGELVEQQTTALVDGVRGAKVLQTELQGTAVTISNKIRQAAVIANNPDTVLTLAKALCEIQESFFGAGGAHAGSHGSLGEMSVDEFERYLKK